MYKVIDINTWKRKQKYLWFNSFANPCYGIDTMIDVTSIVKYSKKTNTSFFINFLYVIMLAVNETEGLRLRIIKDEVVLYDKINPTYTVMTKSGDFENAGNTMYFDYTTFYNSAHEAIEQVKKGNNIMEEYNSNDYDVVYLTCLPWLEYTSMNHPIPAGNKESCSVPRICFSKYSNKDDKNILSFNLTVSHALIDGYETSKAINRIIELSRNFDDVIKGNNNE